MKSQQYSLYSLLPLLLHLPQTIAANPLPLIIPFGGSFGPDGPWHALSATISNTSQQLSLYPAVKAYASVLLGKGVCDGYNPVTDCPANAGGLYSSDNTDDITTIEWTEGGDGFSSDLYLVPNVFNGTGSAKHIGAKVKLGGTQPTEVVIANSSTIRLDKATFGLPNGNTYAPDLGWLSMGGPHTSQEFSRTNGESSIVAPITLNWLSAQNQIPSTTWGMHIGSPKLSIDGSCVWGGYDSSRIVGPVGTFDYSGDSDNFLKFTLEDVSIGVGKGTNPLGYTNGNKTGLLKRADGSGNRPVEVHVHSETPYLYLPKTTCDAIAAELPVTFNSDYGLYIWDTSKETFSNLKDSPAYLGFSFDSTLSEGLRVNVPFSLLMLNLTYPITPKGQSLTYFPCRPYYPPTPGVNGAPAYSAYILGRAFLQAAFIGQSWTAGKYWLAQAPGPDGPTSNIVSLSNDTTSLTSNFKSGSTAWEDSWSDVWKVNNTRIPGAPAPSSVPDKKSSNTGAIAGGAVGGVAVLAAIGGLVIFLLRRKNKRGQNYEPAGGVEGKAPPTDLPIPYDSSSSGNGYNHHNGYGSYGTAGPQGQGHQQYSVSELAGNGSGAQRQELDGSTQIQGPAELPGNEHLIESGLGPVPALPPPPGGGNDVKGVVHSP